MNSIEILASDQPHQLISDILKGVGEAAATLPGQPMVSYQKKQIAETKGELITGIAIAIGINIASNVIYDLLKSMVSRFSQRKDFDPNLTIKINSKDLSLALIMKSDSKTIELKIMDK